MNPVLRFLLWLDIKILWVGTFGKSRPGETISAAAWSLRLDSKWQGKFFVPIIDRLAQIFGDDPDHCRRAYEWQISIYR